MYKFILPFFLSFATQFSFSQDTEASLRKKVAQSKDTSLVSAYLSLGRFYAVNHNQTDSLIKYSKKALLLSQKLKEKKYEVFANIRLGVGYFNQGDFVEGEKYFLAASKIAKKEKFNEHLADVNIKLGSVYTCLEKPDKGIHFTIKGAKYAEKAQDYEQLSMAYYNLSYIFLGRSDTIKRLNYLQKAIRTVEKYKVKDETVQNMYSFAWQTYLELSNGNLNYLDSALLYLDKGMEIVEKNNWMHLKPSYYTGYSGLYFARGKYDESLKMTQETIALLRPTNAHAIKFNAYMRMAEIYDRKKNKEMAYAYLDTLAKNPILKDDYHAWKLAKASVKIYKKFGSTDLALKAFEEQYRLNAKLNEADRLKVISELETKYQSELKDAQIAQLNQQKKIDELEIDKKRSQIFWLFAIGSIILLVVAVIIFFLRQRNVKQSVQILETEQRLNRARMEPHFFFNALSSIQTYALNEQSPKTAMMLSKFSKIMRQSLESTYSEMVTIEEDESFLVQYMELQKMRHPGVFDFEITNVDAVEIDEILVPSMLLQPFIENSIEHGFKNKREGGLIQIIYQKVGDALSITVKDNGAMEPESSEPKTHISRAVQIIKDRLYLLTKLTHKAASYELFDGKGENGYQVNLTLPLMFK